MDKFLEGVASAIVGVVYGLVVLTGFLIFLTFPTFPVACGLIVVMWAGAHVL